MSSRVSQKNVGVMLEIWMSSSARIELFDRLVALDVGRRARRLLHCEILYS